MLFRMFFIMVYLDDFYIEVMVGEEVVCLVLIIIEFKLLIYLVRNLRKVCFCEELFNVCLLEGDILDRMVDSYMSKLCKKLEFVGFYGVLESIRGMGYWLGEKK